MEEARTGPTPCPAPRGWPAGGELRDDELKRDTRVRKPGGLTDRIASVRWTLEEVKELRRALAVEMKREGRWMEAGWAVPAVASRGTPDAARIARASRVTRRARESSPARVDPPCISR